MNKKNKKRSRKSFVVMMLTFAVWFLLCIALSLYYIYKHLNSHGLEGYEKEWDWQLFFFAISQFPYLFILLIILIVVEFFLLK